MKVDKTPNTVEAQVTPFFVIPDDTVYSDKRYYHGSIELLQVQNYYVVNIQ